MWRAPGCSPPLPAYLTIQDNAIATSMEPDLLLEQMVFLDESGAPVDGFQGTGVGGSAAPMLFEADAFVPVSPDQLSAVRLGEHTLDIVLDRPVSLTPSIHAGGRFPPAFCCRLDALSVVSCPDKEGSPCPTFSSPRRAPPSPSSSA